MPLTINLIALRERDLTLQGELSPEELGLMGIDDLLHPAEPLMLDLVAELVDDAILLQGSWRIQVGLDCGRCLKRFGLQLAQEEWACHLPLKGEEAVPLVNDLVDLTLPLREDILLALPSHPVCAEDCAGLPKARVTDERGTAPEHSSGAWAALDKLKL